MSSSQAEPPSAITAQGPPAGRLRLLIEWLAKATDVMAIVLLLLLLTVVFAMVVTRSVFNLGMAWLDDLARYLQIWVVYTVAISITMKGEHITMDALYVRLPSSWQLIIRRLWGMTSLVVCALTGYLALQQALEVMGRSEVSATGVLPAVLGYASLPFGFGLMVVASLYYLLYISRSG